MPFDEDKPELLFIVFDKSAKRDKFYEETAISLEDGKKHYFGSINDNMESDLEDECEETDELQRKRRVKKQLVVKTKVPKISGYKLFFKDLNELKFAVQLITKKGKCLMCNTCDPLLSLFDKKKK